MDVQVEELVIYQLLGFINQVCIQFISTCRPIDRLSLLAHTLCGSSCVSQIAKASGRQNQDLNDAVVTR
jgi:hypothetical protein